MLDDGQCLLVPPKIELYNNIQFTRFNPNLSMCKNVFVIAQCFVFKLAAAKPLDKSDTSFYFLSKHFIKKRGENNVFYLI